VIVIVLANLVVLVRLGVLAAVLAPGVLPHLLPVLVGGLAGGTLGAAFGVRHLQPHQSTGPASKGPRGGPCCTVHGGAFQS